MSKVFETYGANLNERRIALRHMGLSDLLRYTSECLSSRRDAKPLKAELLERAQKLDAQ